MSTTRLVKESTGASIQFDDNPKVRIYYNSVRMVLASADPTTIKIETDGKDAFEVDTTQDVYVNGVAVTGSSAAPVLSASEIMDLLRDEVFVGDGGLSGSVLRLNDLTDVDVGESPINGKVVKFNGATGKWEAGTDSTGSGGSGGAAADVVATYADIDLSDTSVRWIKVMEDENNNGNKSMYFHDGTSLEFQYTIA